MHFVAYAQNPKVQLLALSVCLFSCFNLGSCHLGPEYVYGVEHKNSGSMLESKQLIEGFKTMLVLFMVCQFATLVIYWENWGDKSLMIEDTNVHNPTTHKGYCSHAKIIPYYHGFSYSWKISLNFVGVHVVAGMSQKKMKGNIAVCQIKTIIVIFSWVQTFFIHEKSVETIVIYMNMLCMLWSLSLRFGSFLCF
ncbi:hypothetical protein ACJX0J_012366 [Zea mays]